MLRAFKIQLARGQLASVTERRATVVGCESGLSRGWRRCHFAIAWFLVLNGVSYLTQMAAFSFRGAIPRTRSRYSRTACAFVRPRRAKLSTTAGMRLAYTSAILFEMIVVLSRLAICKPVQLHWIALAFGGYDFARVVHLSCLVLLVLFTVMHLVLVRDASRRRS